MTLQTDSSPAVITAPPRAAALSESLRGMGYTLGTSVADIVDNSIAAGARRIDVRIERNTEGAAERVLILDDGRGMTREELVRAMSLGSISPTEARRSDDLGRFGLGLKTASFAQCRRLTVASKTAEGLSAFTWDLDRLAECDAWELIEDDATAFSDLIAGPTGTVVLWTKLDRALGPSSAQELAAACTRLSSHLRLVFHRFLEAGDFTLTFNGRALSAWDPFFSKHPAKPRDFPEVTWPERATKPKVRLRAFVLPDPELSKQAVTLFGPADELDLQGFFIYRGKRLIHCGGWLNLKDLKKSPDFKLARIRVDFENTDDFEWRIDIRKSMATPPRALRDWLRLHAVRTRTVAAESLGSDHPAERRQAATQLWRKERGSAPMPDMSDPVLAVLFERVADRTLEPAELEGFLEILAASHPSQAGRAAFMSPSDEVIVALRTIARALAKNYAKETVREILQSREPFQSWKTMLDTLFSEETA